MQFSPASSFLLPCLCSDQGPSPWTDKPVLSTIKCTGFPDDGLFLMRISSVLVLLDRVVWSGIGNASFINWKMDVTKPSVYRSGRCNNSRMESIISIARSEYFCWPPRFFLELDFHFLITSLEIQKQIFPRFLKFFSYSDQFTPWYFDLYFGFRFRLWASMTITPNYQRI